MILLNITMFWHIALFLVHLNNVFLFENDRNDKIFKIRVLDLLHNVKILTPFDLFRAKIAEKTELIKIIEKEHQIMIYLPRNILFTKLTDILTKWLKKDGFLRKFLKN